MNNDMSSQWTNAKTGQAETFDGFPPSDRLQEFLPQSPAAQEMYQCLLAIGHTPEYAFCKVLDSCTPGTPSVLAALIEAGRGA